MNCKKINYKIGDAFWVSKHRSNSLGLCQVQAMDGRGQVIGYFYKIASTEKLSTDTLKCPDMVMRFGDLDIVENRWRKADIFCGFKLNEPQFFKFLRESMFGQKWVALYDQSCKLISEYKADSGEGNDLPEDTLFGAGLVVSKLEQFVR